MPKIVANSHDVIIVSKPSIKRLEKPSTMEERNEILRKIVL
ncbi:MAG: hypothetical protein ABIL37_01275 [candidate division WOR-3 bacterium]